jgi:hypothetical protein
LHPYPDFDGTQPCTQVDPEAWFPQGSLGYANRVAIKICESCHFREKCLDYALAYKVDGIWGGTTVPQRRVIRKNRKIIPLPVVSIYSSTPEAIKARERRAKKREDES